VRERQREREREREKEGFEKCFRQVSQNHPMAEDLFHADTQKDKRTDKHNDVNSPLSQFIVGF
jgi:hypothetical protein